MYNILIADDEQWVRRWLETVLLELPFPIRIVDSCDNGEVALLKSKGNQVDIVITDINMPILGGLEFVRKLNNAYNQKPQIIVISGYDEFSYAKEAIELGVVGYLLKPLERKELSDMVEKAIINIEKSNQIDDITKEIIEVKIEKKLYDISRELNSGDINQLSELISAMDLKGKYFACGIMQPKNFGEIVESKEYIKAELKKIYKDKRVVLFQKDAYTWEFLIVDIAYPTGLETQNSLSFELTQKYYIGISQVKADVKEIKTAIIEARNDIISKFNLCVSKGNITVSVQDLYLDFLSAIRSYNFDGIEKCTTMSVFIFSDNDYDLLGCLNFYFILVGEAIKLITDKFNQDIDDKFSALIEEGYEFSLYIREIYNIEAICKQFETYVNKVILQLKSYEYSGISDIISKVEYAIKEKYATDINLSGIANEFQVNPSYLSKKFKEQVGRNFVDYLTNVRIQQAKGLLKQTSMSIKNISQEVGFRDAKYFSKVFTSVVGVKPSEFREEKKAKKVKNED